MVSTDTGLFIHTEGESRREETKTGHVQNLDWRTKPGKIYFQKGIRETRELRPTFYLAAGSHDGGSSRRFGWKVAKSEVKVSWHRLIDMFETVLRDL